MYGDLVLQLRHLEGDFGTIYRGWASDSYPIGGAFGSIFNDVMNIAL
jgi:hypothetical protein